VNKRRVGFNRLECGHKVLAWQVIQAMLIQKLALIEWPDYRAALAPRPITRP